MNKHEFRSKKGQYLIVLVKAGFDLKCGSYNSAWTITVYMIQYIRENTHFKIINIKNKINSLLLIKDIFNLYDKGFSWHYKNFLKNH